MFSQHLESHEGSTLSLRTGNVIEKASRFETAMKGIEIFFGVAPNVRVKKKVRKRKFGKKHGIRLLKFSRKVSLYRVGPLLISLGREGERVISLSKSCHRCNFWVPSGDQPRP